MKKSLFAVLLLGVSASAASALDLSELLPCKPAAAKFCDRAGGMDMSNLLRCGATLAALATKGDNVGTQCRQVLKRYGQLQ